MTTARWHMRSPSGAGQHLDSLAALVVAEEVDQEASCCAQHG